MTTLTEREREAPYLHVVSEEPIREARRLLVALPDPGRDTSVWSSEGGGSRVRSLLELEGLGAEIWTGVDPVGYVRQLRDEWDAP